MSAQDLWDKLDALPWPGPWVAHTFEVDCPCPNGEDCGAMHDCTEVEDRTAYPSSPEDPAEPGSGQCVVQINTPGLETFAKPCAEFIAAARNELPAIRARLADLELFMSQIGVYARSATNLPMIRVVVADAARGREVKARKVVTKKSKRVRPLAKDAKER